MDRDTQKEFDRQDEEGTHTDIDDYVPEEKKKVEAWEAGAKQEIRRRHLEEEALNRRRETLKDMEEEEKNRLEDFAFKFPLQEKWIQEHYDD